MDVPSWYGHHVGDVISIFDGVSCKFIVAYEYISEQRTASFSLGDTDGASKFLDRCLSAVGGEAPGYSRSMLI